jgi:hypothetical protein
MVRAFGLGAGTPGTFDPAAPDAFPARHPGWRNPTGVPGGRNGSTGNRRGTRGTLAPQILSSLVALNLPN